MRPMTPAEKETSRRVCEILGITMGGLCTWLIFLTEFGVYANRFLTLSSVGLIVAFSYGGLFYGLDVWWRKFSARHGTDARPNWIILPFGGLFLAYSNITLLFRGPALTAAWLEKLFEVTCIGGLLMWCIMFFFWLIGCTIRALRD